MISLQTSNTSCPEATTDSAVPHSHLQHGCISSSGAPALSVLLITQPEGMLSAHRPSPDCEATQEPPAGPLPSPCSLHEARWAAVQQGPSAPWPCCPLLGGHSPIACDSPSLCRHPSSPHCSPSFVPLHTTTIQHFSYQVALGLSFLIRT